ncbi:6,7-dimethyl-8-ribityllumazine synthase [Gammaproteobacteria bacterium]|nr:6,7-dimethyl-8-ribityllumazine synthase [Gammaproteobacteria bacterium]
MNNTPSFDAEFKNLANKNVLIVTTAWNKDFLAPAVEEIAQHAKAEEIALTLKFCPGSLELAATIKRTLKDAKFHGVIALGLVIKGDTPHFKLVSRQTFHDLGKVALDFETTPLVNGVLTVDNKVQAEERINPEKMNKGREFSSSLFQMMSS